MSASIDLWKIDTQHFDFSKQSAFVYAKIPSRFQAIVLVASKRVYDHLCFHRLQGGIHGGVGRRLKNCVFKNVWQAIAFNLPLRTEHEGVLNDVFQFTDIARIIVRYEECKGLMAYACNNFATQSVKLGDKVLHKRWDIFFPIAQWR